MSVCPSLHVAALLLVPACTASSMALLAPIVWAQRKASLYFAINLPDVTESKIELSATGLKFSGTSNKKAYTADLEFFGELDTAAEVRCALPHVHLLRPLA